MNINSQLAWMGAEVVLHPTLTTYYDLRFFGA